MKILLAADGSKYTKKALAFLVNQDSLSGPDNEVVVLHVQPVIPPRVKGMVGAAAVKSYHEEEAAKVLDPIRKFLDRKGISYKAEWRTGNSSEEILAGAKKAKAHMIVMGTHGHGLLGRAVMGSVAQRVIAQCDIPVLLVK
ncbi:universal stress protein [uncultured Ramlibacter sp.]|uniref:universal stress protein n=1 Tax=uncultured Ramlibacter sp. TaxID=260755 RepID=UPI0026209D97|nr:universal stress protein [uncultured Ramlibacter sp.]